MGALDGRVVVVTRPADGTSTLTDLLRAAGATVLEAPAIEILPSDDTGPLDDAVADLNEGEFAWVVFSSPRAVDAVCERMDALDLPRGIRAMIAAVGPATAAALLEAGFHVHLVADPYTTEALASQFPSGRGRVLLPRADIAPPGMEEALAAKGWTPVRVVAYRTGSSATLSDDVEQALADGRVDAVTFTSASTVRGFASLTAARPPAVAIGPVTARAAREEGFAVAAMADPHTLGGVAAAVARAVGSRAIFHITESAAAEAAREAGSYEDASLTGEGFIHCSFREQVAAVANAFYVGRSGLVLMEINPNRLSAELRIEPGTDAPEDLFPHVYGPVNWDAVVTVHPFTEGPNGFEPPG